MKKFYPVIHARSKDQIITNVKVAWSLRADGVFLINHGNMDDCDFQESIKLMVDCYQAPYDYEPAEVEDRFEFKIGVNFLGLDNTIALARAYNLGCRMLWVDNSLTDKEDPTELNKFKSLHSSLENKIEVFGGVQFKYQPKPNCDIQESVRRARGQANITLSGPRTGCPADLTFIQKAKEAAGDCRLAIASGITAENAPSYIKYIDDFLVSSSIITPNDYWDIEKFEKLRQIIQS